MDLERIDAATMVFNFFLRSLYSNLVYYGCWIIVLVLLTILALRKYAHDASMILIWINSFTNFLYLPSYPIVVYALIKRHWILAILSSLVIVGQVFIVRAKFSRLKTACNERFQITFMSANLFSGNIHFAKILDEIKSVDPDIIALQEYTPDCHSFFTAAEVFKTWPYRTCVPRDDTFGSAIFSKLRIIEANQFYLDDVSFPQSKALIDMHGRTVQLFNVHLIPPGIRDYSLHLYQQKRLIQILATHLNTPFILAGDFNLTEYSYFISQISNVAASAFNLAHNRFCTTWPNFRFFPSILRIDHIFLSHHLSCQRIVTGTGSGSDHRPLIATLCFKQ